MVQQAFTIYCHINRVNGKRYVGQTMYSVEWRWKEHLSDAKRHRGSRVFSNAIRKYGDDGFEHKVLEVVSTQEEADAAEVRWIAELNCRVPNGYNLTSGGGAYGVHHEESKLLMGEASRARWRAMTPEQRAKRLQMFVLAWTPDRRVRARALMQSQEQRESMVAGHRRYWAKLSPEERSEVLRHKLSLMSPKVKSERVRKQWANMSPEAREERTRKFVEMLRETHSTPEYSKKMSDWQTANQATLTPEQKLEVKAKSWASRREKYGPKGYAHFDKEKCGEASRRMWANLTPEERIERGIQRGLKIKEGRRRAKEARLAARQPRLLFNLLEPRVEVSP
jgi:group I intron endonuclease